MRKNKKTTTPKQYEIIVSYMKQHENLFGSCTEVDSTQIKDRRKQLWVQLTEELNRNGPPVRKCNEWKIIWSDYKYNLKRKLAADIKLGRKNYKKSLDRSLPFNKRERTVLAMLGLKDEETDRNENETSLDKDTYLPNNVLAPFLPQNDATGSDVDIVEEIIDSKESVVLCNDEFIKEEPVIQSMGPLSFDEELMEAPKSDVNVPPTFSSVLLSMERTQQAILKELKESNRQKNQEFLIKERLLTLEQQKFDEMKLQNYEENKRAYIMIELKRKELELYELKLKGLCTQCTQFKAEIDSE